MMHPDGLLSVADDDNDDDTAVLAGVVLEGAKGNEELGQLEEASASRTVAEPVVDAKVDSHSAMVDAAETTPTPSSGTAVAPPPSSSSSSSSSSATPSIREASHSSLSKKYIRRQVSGPPRSYPLRFTVTLTYLIHTWTYSNCKRKRPQRPTPSLAAVKVPRLAPAKAIARAQRRGL